MKKQFEVIIVGGSYAGLSAALSLGRALMNVLVIDNGQPCNAQTPASHNFLTNDGKAPAEIAAIARQQINQYHTVRFFNGTAISGSQTTYGFEIGTDSGERFVAKQLIFATGIKDLLPAIPGLAECWGISVIHCPYCHGYEVRGQATGILGHSPATPDFARLISNWTKELTVYTNGPANFGNEHFTIIEKEIAAISHNQGHIRHLQFKDGTQTPITALYAPSPFMQHCPIPENLGCALTEEGYIKVDDFGHTSIKGIYAIGDNCGKMRTVANAVAMGTTAGIAISKQMILNQIGTP